jgi:hypothetical protein
VKNLEASLYYYKNVASTYNDPARETAIKDAVIKLEKVLKRIEDELRGKCRTILYYTKRKLTHFLSSALDDEVARHEKTARELMTVPDLTKYRVSKCHDRIHINESLMNA